MSNVMIVDDDQIISQATKTILLSHGFGVETASNGQECLGKLGSFKPDVMLLDLMMPGLTPAEIIEKIRERKIHVKIIYFSALKKNNETEKKIRRGLTSEMDGDYVVDYIEKPFTIKVLLDAVNSALNRK